MVSVRPPDEKVEKELAQARKQHSSYMYGSAVLRITDLCAPKCLDISQVQVSKDEKICLSNCVKGLHGVTESTLRFFKDFEN